MKFMCPRLLILIEILLWDIKLIISRFRGFVVFDWIYEINIPFSYIRIFEKCQDSDYRKYLYVIFVYVYICTMKKKIMQMEIKNTWKYFL